MCVLASTAAALQGFPANRLSARWILSAVTIFNLSTFFFLSFYFLINYFNPSSFPSIVPKHSYPTWQLSHSCDSPGQVTIRTLILPLLVPFLYNPIPSCWFTFLTFYTAWLERISVRAFVHYGTALDPQKVSRALRYRHNINTMTAVGLTG